MLASAGATLYGALAAVPSLLVAISVGALLLGRDRLASGGERLADTVPAALGAGGWVDALFSAGLSLSPLAVAFAIFMGSAYGRGLSRALRRFAPATERELPPSWRSRALTLPLLGLAPLLLAALLLVTPAVADLLQDDTLLGIAGASYLGLNAIWVITWLPLTWAFRVVAPGHPSWRAALIGGVVTGAFISGFLQGFTLFLALPVDLGRPFGGLVEVGVTSALLLWLWVLHVVVCIGYTFTWTVDAQLRAPVETSLSGQVASPE
ncbi:MAG TPA: YhjD/YihY/BrkB family envelope integrity protein [Kineosporiaceae bacterium]|nr:YhjD/YihY/BrkB family envelope integrity protein [Kineosporiaceae bacterium]